MNLLEQFYTKEIPNQVKIECSLERKLFDEFGFNQQEFLRDSSDFYYQHLLELADTELSIEQQIYNDPEIYSFRDDLKIIAGPNCYAFALRKPLNPMTGTPYTIKPFPGALSLGFIESSSLLEKVLTNGTVEQQKEILSYLVTEDARKMGMEVNEVGADYKPQKDEWLIAIVATAGTNTNYPYGDFHFYRKGESGIWYHKPGTTAVQNTDAAGKLIYDPAKCNRDIYEHFLGYYSVRSLY